MHCKLVQRRRSTHTWLSESITEPLIINAFTAACASSQNPVMIYGHICIIIVVIWTSIEH
jgi:hypothetical protein